MTERIDRRQVLKTFRLGGGAALAALALAGCGITSGPAPRTFDLSAASGLGSVGGSGAHIVVMSPRALPALDNDKILVRQSAGEISYYPDARWSSPLGSLVQTRLTQAFENTGRVRAIGQQGDGIAADYLVVTEIRDFALDAADNRTAKVSLFVKLINDRSGRVVASALFEASEPVASDTPDGVVAALNAAFEAAQRRIVAFTLKRI